MRSREDVLTLAKFRVMASDQTKASLWYTVANICQKGMWIAVVPVLTRLMTEQQYGQYSLFQSWYNVVVVFATLDLWMYVFSNGMLVYEKDRAGLVSSMLGLSTLMTSLLAILYLCFPKFWNDAMGLPEPMVLLILLRCLLYPVTEYWCSRLRYECKYKPVVAFSLAMTTLLPVLSIPAVMLFPEKGLAAAAAQVAVVGIVCVFPLVSLVRGSRKFFVREYWVAALRFSLPLVPHFLAVQVLSQVGRIQIAQMCGQEYAGIYSVAYMGATLVSIVGDAIAVSFIPWSYERMRRQDYDSVRRMARRMLFLVGTLNLALVLCAPEVMMLLAPASYQSAVYAVPPMAAGMLLQFLYNLFLNVEYYYGETKLVTVASLGVAVLSIALNWLLIPYLGYVAAGYTVLACNAAFVCAHWIFMNHVTSRHEPGAYVYRGKQLFVVAAALVLSMLLAGAAYPLPIVRISSFVAILIALFVKRRDIIRIVKRQSRDCAHSDMDALCGEDCEVKEVEVGDEEKAKSKYGDRLKKRNEGGEKTE